MKSEFWRRDKKTEKYTKTQAFKDFPHLKEDVENEIRNFKKSNDANLKISYKDGLEVWLERTLDEVKNSDKGFQERTEQVERPEKKKIIQEPRN